MMHLNDWVGHYVLRPARLGLAAQPPWQTVAALDPTPDTDTRAPQSQRGNPPVPCAETLPQLPGCEHHHSNGWQMIRWQLEQSSQWSELGC